MSVWRRIGQSGGRARRRAERVADRRAMGRFWREWLRPFRWRFALSIGLIFAFAAANSLYPEIIRRTVDALKVGDVSVLGWLAPLIIVATAVKGVTLYAQKVVANRTLTELDYQLQNGLFRHLIEADVAWLAREAPAALASRLTADIGLVSSACDRVVNTALRNIFMLIGLVGALFWIDWELTLIALAIFPPLFWPISKIGRSLRKLARRSNEQIGRMSATATESFSGVRVTKTYGLEDYIKAKAERDFAAIRKLKRARVRHQAVIDPMMEIFAGISVAAVVWLVGARIASGENTIGDISGFITALLLAAQPFRALSNLNATIQTGLAGLHRFYGMLDAKPTVAERPGAPALRVTEGEIVFDRVSFRYGDGTPALEELTLRAPGGARLALVGRSGAGKSTLFNLLPRLYDVSEGAIRIDGRDVREVSLASLRGAMAFVSQEAVLFNDTVAANIALGRRGASREEIEAAARAAAAHDFIEALPGGYDTPVGERGERLSGGQRQRVAIARAFLRDAPILLFDEATSALDAESESAIREAVDRLAKGRTTLVIAHRLATILDADLIAVLDRGRLAELGTHRELVERDGLYARLYRLQFGEAAGG